MKNVIYVLAFFLVIACGKDDAPEQVQPQNYSIEGVAQKGPYQIGATVTVSELDNQLNPTGKTYNTSVDNSFGHFQVPNATFSSKYVKVRVYGQYYHEIRKGVPVGEDLGLEAIVDLSQSTTVNVNVLTHLQQARMVKLVQDGASFSQARDQAYDELLDIFFLDHTLVDYPETIDLTDNTYSGAVLFAVSNIIANHQGARSGTHTPEVMNEISADFALDGTIDVVKMQEVLASGALFLELNTPRENLIDKYATLGKSINPKVSTKILKNFLNQTTFPSLASGVFPSSSGAKLSLLTIEDTLFLDKSKQYMLSVDPSQSTAFSSINIFVRTLSGSYSTPGVSWTSLNGSQMKQINPTDPAIEIPFTFTGSGTITMDLLMIIPGAGMPAIFPTKTIIWQ